MPDYPFPASSPVPLLGSRQVWFGHSFLTGGGVTDIDLQFITLLDGMLRADVDDLGVGASQAACDNFWLRPANGGGQNGWGGWAWCLQNSNPYRTSAPYTPGANYLPGFMTGLNDATQRSHQSSGNPRTIFKTAMRAMLSRQCAARLYEDATWSSGTVTSGTLNITNVFRWEGLAVGMKLWGPNIPAGNTIASFTPGSPGTIVMAGSNATGTNPGVFYAYDPALAFGGATWLSPKIDANKNSGTTYWPIPGNAATITFTIPADFEGGTVAFGFTVWPASDGQITWSGTAAGFVGGVALASAPTSALAGLAYADGTDAATQNTNQRHSSNGHVVRITGLTSADAGKTIIATYGSGAGTTFSTPAALGTITHGGTPATTTYTYTHLYRTYNGDTLEAATTTTATGPATLTSVNTNILPAGAAWPSGVESELIIRTVGGTTQGLIAVLTAGPAIVTDTGLSGPAYGAATANPLVGGAAFDYVQIESNTPTTYGVVCNITTPPAATLAALTPTVTATDVANYNADLQSVVAEFAQGQFLYVDCDSALAANALYFNASPNVHPNNRGHAILAETVANAIITWAANIPLRYQAMQSRVESGKGNVQSVRRYMNALPAGAAGNLPIAGPLDLLGSPSSAGQDYTLGASIAAVDLTNLVFQIDAQVGDDIEVALAGMYSAVATTAALDVAFCDTTGHPLRYFCGAPGSESAVLTTGWPGWYSAGATAILERVSGSAFATVQRGDLSTVNTVPGIITLALFGFSSAGTRVLFGGGTSGNPPLYVCVKNLGRRNTPGFNAS